MKINTNYWWFECYVMENKYLSGLNVTVSAWRPRTVHWLNCGNISVHLSYHLASGTIHLFVVIDYQLMPLVNINCMLPVYLKRIEQLNIFIKDAWSLRWSLEEKWLIQNISQTYITGIYFKYSWIKIWNHLIGKWF